MAKIYEVSTITFLYINQKVNYKLIINFTLNCFLTTISLHQIIMKWYMYNIFKEGEAKKVTLVMINV